jgi:hypothetical protein
VEWLAKQPWSTEKIGTFGSSQGGFVQNFLAVTEPPHLVCQYMTDTGLSLYHEGYRIGGTTRMERFKTMGAVCRDPEDQSNLLHEWLKHPTYDDYWKAEDCSRFFHKMNVPCYTVGSWYDFMCVGSIDSYIGRQHLGGKASRGNQQLRIGPWLHGRRNKGNKVGELVYPENATFDLENHMIEWFDVHLKGKQRSVTDEPTVKYYVMGAVGEEDSPGNEWRSANDWPIATTPVPYFLQDGGKLILKKPAEEKSATTYLSDPVNPAEIPARGFPGARDARKFEEQDNVLTFTTDVLKRPVEWTGKVQAELFVSSTAKDTDFFVRITDVYPDGRSILIIDYIRRARYRDGYEKEVFMEDGKVYKVAFDVGSLSQIFNTGHKIRVTVASTGAPFYEPNPNTGEPLTLDFPEKTVVAKNTVHHNRQHASKIIAPIPKERNVSDDYTRPEMPENAGPVDDDAPEGFLLTDSGLKYRVLRASEGTKPTAADSVTVHYHGWTANGNVFDSSFDRGQDISFGLNQVIKGWTEGLQLVGEGGMIELEIPGHIAYGPNSPTPAIPPNATLYFLVELFKVN